MLWRNIIPCSAITSWWEFIECKTPRTLLRLFQKAEAGVTNSGAYLIVNWSACSSALSMEMQQLRLPCLAHLQLCSSVINQPVNTNVRSFDFTLIYLAVPAIVTGASLSSSATPQQWWAQETPQQPKPTSNTHSIPVRQLITPWIIVSAKDDWTCDTLLTAWIPAGFMITVKDND